MQDVWCYTPFLAGWLIFTVSWAIVLSALESAGLTKDETPEEKQEAKNISTFFTVVLTPVFLLAPVVGFAFVLASWWAYYIYCVFEPPENIKRAANHITFAVMMIYTSLVLFGLVHKQPEFLLKMNWRYDLREGFAERVEQNYPLTSQQLKTYLRSESLNIRVNALYLVQRHQKRRITDPEIFELLFDIFENDPNELAFECAQATLYTQQSHGWLSTEQLKHLGQLKRSGAAERFYDPAAEEEPMP